MIPILATILANYAKAAAGPGGWTLFFEAGGGGNGAGVGIEQF